MTTVFNVIPEGFFKVLTSKHKEIFLASIFHIDDLLQDRIYCLRGNVAQSLQSYFSNMGISLNELTYEDEYEEEIKSLQTLAYSILRSLQKSGWIRVNYNEDFIEQISFPNYANKFIKVLRDIDTNQMESYNRYIFSTFSNLKTGLEEPDNLLAGLEASWNHTRDLQRALQNVYYELNEVYSKILDELSTNELLKQHFDVYKQSTVEHILYPLKTRDSLPRFKNSILQLIEKYDTEENIERLIKQKINESSSIKPLTPEEAEKVIMSHLNDLSDFYKEVSNQIEIIDNKKSDYTAKSIGKIQYRLKADYQLKEKIDLFIRYLRKSEEEELYDLANILEFQNVEDSFLYEPRKRKEENLPQERKKIDLSKGREAELIKKQMEELMIWVNPLFSSKNVDAYVLNLLKGRDEISTIDYPISSYEEFIYTIMGAIRGYEDNQCGYSIRFQATDVKNGYYQVPEMTFIKEK